MPQYTLTEAQLAEAHALATQYGSLRALMSARAEAMGLRAFADCVKQDSMGNVARALRGDGRKVPVEWLERYIEHTGDRSPILFLVGKHVDADEELLKQLKRLLVAARASKT